MISSLYPSVVLVVLSGATKRSSQTSSLDKTEEKIRALEDELNMGFMRV